jgi:hypothetical protein
MKKTVCSFILWVAIVSTIQAQQVTVTVARKNNEQGVRTDLGYFIISEGTLAQQRSMGTSKLFEKYPDLHSYEIISSEKKHIVFQNILVIIASTKVGENNESEVVYGVGFGYTEEAALKNAVSWIKLLNPQWSLEKHGYAIELTQDFASQRPPKTTKLANQTTGNNGKPKKQSA